MRPGGFREEPAGPEGEAQQPGRVLAEGSSTGSSCSGLTRSANAARPLGGRGRGGPLAWGPLGSCSLTPPLTWAPPQALAWHLIHEQIPLSVDLQAGLDCCCLALQLPGLRRLLAAPEMVTRACSLVHCIRLILEASECRSRGSLRGYGQAISSPSLQALIGAACLREGVSRWANGPAWSSRTLRELAPWSLG